MAGASVSSMLVRWAVAALTLCSTPACERLFGAEDDLYINSTMHKVVSESEALNTPAPAGRTCSNVTAGSGSGSASGSNGGGTDDFWMREDTNSSGSSVVIGSFDQVLERRRYDLDFISGYQFDRFIVTTRSGDQYAFNYWGSDTCNDCPSVEYEALPGDVWGCGTPSSESAPDEGANPIAPSIDAQR